MGYSFLFVPKATLIMMFLYVISGLLPYGSSYLLGNLVNSVVKEAGFGSLSNIWFALVLYAFVNALPSVMGNLQRYINRKRMIVLQMETEIDLMRRRELIDIASYEDPKFQDLIQRTFRNGPNPIYQLSNTQFDIIRSLTSLVFGTYLAIHFSPLIYLVVIVTAIPSFITDIKFAGQNWSIWAKDSPAQRRFGDLRQHILFRTLLIETKLMQLSKKLFTWMREILTDFASKQFKLEKNRVLATTLTDTISLIGFTIGLALVLRGVVSGATKVGTLVYMMGTLSTVRNSISNLLEQISGQFENHLIVTDMMEFFSTKPVIIESENPTKINLKEAPEIIFENVGFKYPNANNWVLQNIYLTFTAGNKIGLVGNNGAGKTTLVKLLCRIYDPTEGRILVNGVDLKEISTKEWWSYLGIMFQDYASYDFAVKEAIGIGRPDKSINMVDVKTAAETAQAHTFIEEWKDSYDQQLGVEFGGKEPSKGQRQKLSIAKVIYRDAFVMILDEPTASVDAESEAKIFDSLENLSKTTTAILISHDFSTISECDQIFVLDKGSLIENGNHKELMKQKGLYAELYNLQAKRFKK